MGILSRKWKKIVFFGLWVILFLIIWTKMLVLEPDGLYAGWVNVWGDWAAHLSYATVFGYGSNFLLEMPILAGAKFSYPFLADWFSGVLMKMGVSMVLSMILPGFVLSMVLVLVLVKLGEKILKSFKAGVIISLLFLFNGGLGFWWWLKDISVLGFFETMRTLPHEYTHLEGQANIQWINMISSQVVPQRGFLMGFPLAILVYVMLWQSFLKKKGKKLLLAGLITAALPLIQAHSFVLVSFVAFWLMVIEVIKKKKITLLFLVKWMWFWLPIMLLGFPQVWYFYGGSLRSQGFIRWQPGWMTYKDQSNWIWFWVKNLGFSLGLTLVGIKLASKKLRLFSLPFWGLFLMANLWIFQPWEWDNTKILTHWYLMASVLGAMAVVKGLKNKKTLIKGITIIVLILSIWAGFLDTWRLGQYQQRRIKFFTNQELQLAEWVKNNTKREAKFLTADNHDHFVPVLTGRKIVLGFKGWLWTYGLDYLRQEKAVKLLFEGGEKAIKTIEDFEIDYVVIGPKEKAKEINEQFYEDNFEAVYELGGTKIFKVLEL